MALTPLYITAEGTLNVPGNLHVGGTITGQIVGSAPVDTTYYVASDGDDNNNGLTALTPFLTIGQAESLIPLLVMWCCPLSYSTAQSFNESRK